MPGEIVVRLTGVAGQVRVLLALLVALSVGELRVLGVALVSSTVDANVADGSVCRHVVLSFGVER